MFNGAGYVIMSALLDLTQLCLVSPGFYCSLVDVVTGQWFDHWPVGRRAPAEIILADRGLLAGSVASRAPAGSPSR
jgi:hypothetical protein